VSSDPAPRPIQLFEPITDQDHVIGPPTAPVTLLEYGDYECPDCLNTQPIIAELRKRFGDRLRFAFRHFPVSSIHSHATFAAGVAEAAAEQGKFWEMHERLFELQKELGEIDITHLALQLGLEIYRFESSVGQDVHRRRIDVDYAGAVRSGVVGTPTFFINGTRYQGPKTVEAIAAAIELAAQH
jgi:protein-disulfide isomerase